MRLELVSIPTDTQDLDGIFYQPEGGATAGAVLLFHGNGMNFYVGAPRFLPPMLTGMGFACLAFNRRGHDILSTRDSRIPEGSAYQTIAQAVADNRHAADFLARRGYPAPVVIGHSNGGMLAVRHVADHPHTPALVLLSAHCGGRQLVPRISATGLLAADRVAEITVQARALVAAGRGQELLALPGWWYTIAAGSFLDLLENVPDILELAPRILAPTLYLRGDQEPAEIYPMEQFAARAGGPCRTELVADCGHFYVGREVAITRLVAGFLAQTLGAG